VAYTEWCLNAIGANAVEVAQWSVMGIS